uniref:NADH-ubiquinone oxidoreductase chain 4 n=1 Tax=Arescus labiatus TaxID=294769 RepID=U3L0B0_9CUCU|nr:NADH dehydrogenase subunit 4 [Arescus labiatus]
MMSLIMYMVFLIPLCFNSSLLLIFMIFFMIFLMMMKITLFSMSTYISFIFGLDSYSYFLMVLSLWICGLSLMSSMKIYKLNNYVGLFNMNLLFLLLSLLMVFLSMNMFIFYLFFEISLIPLLIMIIGWGYQPERLLAGVYMIFYTLLFSLPMMVGLFYFLIIFNSLMFVVVSLMDNFLIYFLINLAFLVKIPLFLVHLWLPKAHVEAPVAGSMILAGIMLKLGGYGLFRFMKVFYCIGEKINIMLIILALLGSMMVSLICLIQTDIKSLIAYSSVVHMGLVVCGILSMNFTGLFGSLLMMIAHGLCSSGLFCLSNMYYERLNSRNMYIMKGLMNLFPNLSLWMFLLSISNSAAPPSLNLVGEIFCFFSLISYNYILMFLLCFISFFSVVYSIFMYAFIQHGQCGSMIYSLYNGLCIEYLLMLLHWFPLNFMFLMMDYFIL